MSFLPSSNGTIPQPFCETCDLWLESSTTSEQKLASRTFTNTPIKAFRVAASVILVTEVETGIKVAFLKALCKLLQHSRIAAAALPLEEGKDPLLGKVLDQLESGTRSLRLAAGLVVHLFSLPYNFGFRF